MSSTPNALQSFQGMNTETPVNHTQTQPVTESVAECAKKKWHLRIVVRDPYFQLWTGKKYQLTVGDDVYTGNTGKTAVIDHPVSPAATSGELLVWVGEDSAAAPLTWKLKIDDVDPLALDTGAETRLRNLGIGWAAAQSGATTERAKLETFQGALQLKDPKYGELDSKTRDKLAAAYSEQQINEVREQYYVWEGSNLW